MPNRLQRFYIPFIPEADIKYIYLFQLYQNAEYNKETKRYDTIRYNNQQRLAEMLNTSSSTVKRLLNDERYKDFFTVDKSNKIIYLLNDIKGKPFVCLDRYEIYFLCNRADNLLCKYLLYIKYYCGYSKNGETDFTAEQFLRSICYSLNSSIPSKLSEYNSLLVEYGYISIKRKRDNQGYKRNIYSYIH